jgi:hypothetical protein
MVGESFWAGQDPQLVAVPIIIIIIITIAHLDCFSVIDFLPVSSEREQDRNQHLKPAPLMISQILFNELLTSCALFIQYVSIFLLKLWHICCPILSCPAYNISAWNAEKTSFHYFCVIVDVETCLFAKPLLNNGSCILAYSAVVA